MRAWARVFTVLICLAALANCGKPDAIDVPQSGPAAKAVPTGPSDIPGVEVLGNASYASFGTDCINGTFVRPSPVPLTLYQCPIGQSSVELVEPIRPIKLRIDCQKRTMDTRGVQLGDKAFAWEFMPDGSFRFQFDGGFAKLKNDGSGNLNCVTPLKAELRGRVDCSDMDKPKVTFQTLWWVGESYLPDSDYEVRVGRPLPPAVPEPRFTVVPSPTPSASPSVRPSAGPSPVPLPSPSPRPSSGAGSGSWWPFPFPSNFTRSDLIEPQGGANSGPVSCRFPTGCYFYTITQLQQCI